MTSEKLTRKLIEVVLEQGTRFGLDVAGGFMGPVWPFVRPIVEGVLQELPSDIAKRYKSSREAAAEAADFIVKDKKFMDQVSAALDKHGVTTEWLQQVLDGIERLSDDVTLLLSKQAAQGKTLDEVHALITVALAKKPAHLVIRPDRVEYVEYLMIGPAFLPGMDMIPGMAMVSLDHPVGRHIPAGFLIWNFLLMNDGEQLATVTKLTLEVVADLDPPPEAKKGEFLPMLAPFEQDVLLASEAVSYPLFAGKYFKYAPEADVDVFRVRLIYEKEASRVQQLRLVITWHDGTGEHQTISEPIFLASLPKPQLEVSKSKFGYGHV